MKNAYIISGETVVIFIDRKNGDRHEVLIDLADLPKVQTFGAWHLNAGRYVASYHKGKVIRLHHVVAGRTKGHETDHVNHDRMDNRRCNLRTVTHGQNMRNPPGNPASVFWHKREKVWCVAFMVQNRRENFGQYQTRFEAMQVAKAIRKRLRAGEIVRGNRRIARSGYKHIHWVKGSTNTPWHVKPSINGQQVVLKCCHTIDEAVKCLQDHNLPVIAA